MEGEKTYASVLDVPGAVDMATFYVSPAVGLRILDEVVKEGDPGSLVEPGRGRPGGRGPSAGAGAEDRGRLLDPRHRRESRRVRARDRSAPQRVARSPARPPAAGAWTSRSDGRAGFLTGRRRPSILKFTSSLLQSRGPRGGIPPRFQFSNLPELPVDHTMPSNNKRQPMSARGSNGQTPAPAESPAAEPQDPAKTPGTAAPWRRPQHRRAEGHEHPEAHPDRQGPERRRRDRHAQAGADLPDPEGADRAERLHLLGGRARGAARRLRLPARARLQLPARPRRHLRLAVADPPVRPADRRHRLRPDPAAQGRRALLRPAQGRGGQLRAARAGARQDLLREPDAALSAGAAASSRRRRDNLSGARHGPDDADRQGPARPDRRAAAHRQDDAAAEHRAVDRDEPPRGLPDRAADRRAARGSDRHAAVGERRGHLLDLRRAGAAPRAGGRDGDREGQAPGRAQEGRGHPARLDHAPRARLQHR